MTSTCCPTSPGQSHPSYQEHTAKSEVSSGICQPPLVPQANNVQQFSGGSASSSFAPLGTGRVAYSTSSPPPPLLRAAPSPLPVASSAGTILPRILPASACIFAASASHPSACYVVLSSAWRRYHRAVLFLSPLPPLDASVPALQRQTVWLVKQDPAKCRTQEHVKGTS